MATVSIPLGAAGRIWVSVEPAAVTLSNAPYWQQRLTPAEARRLAEALLAELEVDGD